MTLPTLTGSEMCVRAAQFVRAAMIEVALERHTPAQIEAVCAKLTTASDWLDTDEDPLCAGLEAMK